MKKFKVYEFFGILVTSLLILGANPFTQTIAPTDLLVSYPGWSNLGMKPPVIENPYGSDPLDSYFPPMLNFKNRLYNADFPLWTKYRNGGMNAICSVRLGLRTLIFMLIPSHGHAIYIAALLKLLICIYGMKLLLESFSFGLYSSLIGGILFSLSGYMGCYFDRSPSEVVMFLPWLFLFIHHFYKKNDVWSLMAIAFFTCLMILPWFPFVSVVIYYITFIYIVFLSIHYKGFNIRSAGYVSMVCLMMFVGLGLSMFYVIHWVEFLNFSDLGVRVGMRGKLDMTHLSLLVDRKALGPLNIEHAIYIGPIPILLFLVSIPVFLKEMVERKSSAKTMFVSYSFLLTMIGFILVFELVPHHLLRRIPTFDSNLLTRCRFLFCLAMPVPVSYMIDKVERYIMMTRFTRIVSIFRITIFVGVTIPLTIYWRDLNARVSNETFYPQTKTLSYISDQLSHFENVLGDATFFVGGTISAYQIPEWFAHGFRSMEERKYLSAVLPFKTSTAFLPTTDQIKLSNQESFDLLQTRYIISASAGITPPVLKIGVSAFAIDVDSIGVTKIFSPKYDISSNSIEIQFGTHLKDTVFDLRMEVSRNDQILIKRDYNLDLFKDNRWVNLGLDTVMRFMSNEVYSLTIYNYSDNKLSVWADEEKHVNLKIVPIAGNELVIDGWRQFSVEPGITICENIDYLPGAYLLSNIDSQAFVSSLLPTIDLEDYFEFMIPDTCVGQWLVLPMRYYPGWTASIDGKRVDVRKFKGFLPAIYLAQSGRLRYEYWPTYLTMGATCTFICLAFLLVIFFIWPNGVQRSSSDQRMIQ